MAEPDFEIYLDYTESELAQYLVLETTRQKALARKRQRTMANPPFWDGWTAWVGLGIAVSGLVCLIAVLSGAVDFRKGGIIAPLAFAAFYAGFWTPYMTRWLMTRGLSRTSRNKANLVCFRSDYPNFRLSTNGEGIWLSCDNGWRSFMPYSYFHSASVMNPFLVLWTTTTEGSVAVPLRLLTSEQQDRLIKLVGAQAPLAP